MITFNIFRLLKRSALRFKLKVSCQIAAQPDAKQPYKTRDERGYDRQPPVKPSKSPHVASIVLFYPLILHTKLRSVPALFSSLFRNHTSPRTKYPVVLSHRAFCF